MRWLVIYRVFGMIGCGAAEGSPIQRVVDGRSSLRWESHCCHDGLGWWRFHLTGKGGIGLTLIGLGLGQALGYALSLRVGG